MKRTIYYFSGTGNSLDCAKDIAQNLQDTNIVSIPSLKDQKAIIPTTECVGIVFPVYGWAPPRTVKEFAKKLRLTQNNYVFAVATSGGTPGKALHELDKYLNKKLDAGFTVKEDGHQPLKEEILVVRMMMAINTKKARSRKERIPEIVSTIKNRRTRPLEKSSFLANLCGSILSGFASKEFKAADKDLWIDSNCNLCGICTRVCPRKNIQINDKKITRDHDCESCFACLQWCPNGAIHYKKDIENVRSHNPGVSLKEMIIKNNIDKQKR